MVSRSAVGLVDSKVLSMAASTVDCLVVQLVAKMVAVTAASWVKSLVG